MWLARIAVIVLCLILLWERSRSAGKRPQSTQKTPQQGATETAKRPTGVSQASSRTAQEMLVFGVERRDAAEVAAALRRGADPDVAAAGSACPLFLVSGTEGSEERLAAARAVAGVLLSAGADPNGDGRSWPPLKAALSAGHMAMVQLLLADDRTIAEVEVTGLQCSVLSAPLPARLRFLVPRDASPCFAALREDRKVPREASRLIRRYEGRGGTGAREVRAKGVQPRPSAATVHAPSSAAFGPDGKSNPFARLPMDTYPPWDGYVLNPTPFHSIITATLFYCFGPPPAAPIAATAAVMCMLFLVAAAAVVRLISLEYRRGQLAPNI